MKILNPALPLMIAIKLKPTKLHEGNFSFRLDHLTPHITDASQALWIAQAARSEMDAKTLFSLPPFSLERRKL